MNDHFLNEDIFLKYLYEAFETVDMLLFLLLFVAFVSLLT